MDVFYALAEPRRRKVIELLAGRGGMSATQIYSRFEISPQAVSQHLRVLRDAKLVVMERRARQHIYRINPESLLELEGWVERTKRLWDVRLGRLDDVLKEENRRSKRDE